MLTVAYCRVSTEEQAAEGFSIAGQADKLRVYAELHDLGEVTVIADPGQRDHLAPRPAVEELERPHHAGRPLRTGQRGPALVRRKDRPVVGDGPDLLQHPRFLRAVLP
jgi:DNA invertase Pin-like site-specific DNA recombinase